MEASDLLGQMSTFSAGFIITSLLAWALGVIAHFTKKCLREDVGFVQYWMEHKSSSVASLTTGLISLFTILIYYPNPDLLTLFSAGYIMDSIVNKPTNKRASNVKVA